MLKQFSKIERNQHYAGALIFTKIKIVKSGFFTIFGENCKNGFTIFIFVKIILSLLIEKSSK